MIFYQHPSTAVPLRRPSSVSKPDPHQAYPSPIVHPKPLQRPSHQSPYSHFGVATPSQTSDGWRSPYSNQSITAASPQYSTQGKLRAKPNGPLFTRGTEPTEMMAATQIQPQYQMFTPQPQSQPPQNMYYAPFPISHVPPQQPHQMMTPPQSVLPPQHQSHPPLPPHTQAQMHGQAVSASPRPQIKYEPHVPRPLNTGNVTSPTGQLGSSQDAARNGLPNGNNAPSNHLGPNGNPSSAPGPIPATTPLVVRQDHTGVQWIMFEYSRDRVKMEYTIRCDVESVNVEELTKEFKEANCVYPRAFCDKDQYTGNRQAYETECNTVGWSLVKLNPHLQEKRGLIQRAVDSWRNSNQDSRLRSRRVRRQNKQNTRNKSQQSQQAPPRDPSTPSNAMLQQRPLPSTLASSTPPLLQHQQGVDGSLPNHVNHLPLGGQFDPQNPPLKREQHHSSQIRPSNVFQGHPGPYPMHPTQTHTSIPPPMANGLDTHLAPHTASTIARPRQSVADASPIAPPHSGTLSPLPGYHELTSLYPKIPGRKFINVHDAGSSPNKVRVKLDLGEVKTNEIVDDFRERNSVYPRSCVRAQMQIDANEKRQKRLRARFIESDSHSGEGFETGRTTVKIPTMDDEVEAPVPRLSKRIGAREELLNDAGYRISWDQIQKYDRKIIFLQRSREFHNSSHDTFLG